MYLLFTIVMAIAAILMAVIPSLGQLYGDTSTRNEKLNRRGKVFLYCAAVVLVGAVVSEFVKNSESKQELERHNRIIEGMHEASNAELARHTEILEGIRLESLRLVPSDFQLRLTSKTHNNPGAVSIPELPTIHLSGKLGRAEFVCELVEVGDHLKEDVMVTDPRFYGLAGDPRAYGNFLEAELELRYVANNLTFSGLESYPHLYDLDSQTVTLQLPIERLDVRQSYWTHTIDFHVKGRHFSGVADSLGNVRLTLNFNNERALNSN